MCWKPMSKWIFFICHKHHNPFKLNSLFCMCMLIASQFFFFSPSCLHLLTFHFQLKNEQWNSLVRRDFQNNWSNWWFSANFFLQELHEIELISFRCCCCCSHQFDFVFDVEIPLQLIFNFHSIAPNKRKLLKIQTRKQKYYYVEKAFKKYVHIFMFQFAISLLHSFFRVVFCARMSYAHICDNLILKLVIQLKINWILMLASWIHYIHYNSERNEY